MQDEEIDEYFDEFPPSPSFVEPPSAVNNNNTNDSSSNSSSTNLNQQALDNSGGNDFSESSNAKTPNKSKFTFARKDAANISCAPSLKNTSTTTTNSNTSNCSINNFQSKINTSSSAKPISKNNYNNSPIKDCQGVDSPNSKSINETINKVLLSESSTPTKKSQASPSKLAKKPQASLSGFTKKSQTSPSKLVRNKKSSPIKTSS